MGSDMQGGGSLKLRRAMIVVWVPRQCLQKRNKTERWKSYTSGVRVLF